MEDNRASPAWPKSLLATWTILGIFKGRPINATRPCIMCRPGRRDNNKIDGGGEEEFDKFTDENANIEDSRPTTERQGDICDVCLSLLCDADGMAVRDWSKAVPGWLNNRVVGTLSSLSIALFLACCLGTICWYIHEFWGVVQNVTHFVSFVAYAGILLGVALICTVSNVMLYVRRSPGKVGCWYEMLDAGYIARRLRCLAGRKFRLPAAMFLILSMMWAAVNISLQVVSLVQFLNSNASVAVIDRSAKSIQAVPIQTTDYRIFASLKTLLSLVIAATGLPVYAAFWHFVLVLRYGLAAELNLVLGFIKQNEGRLDCCRRRVVEIHRELNILRSVLAGLMPFIVATGVLGLTVHISWNYNVYSEGEKNVARDNLLINILIFSEKFMVLILPLLAVGGLDIDHIWLQFNYALSRQRSTDHEDFWDRLLHFAKELEPEHNDIDLTIFLSVVSLYLGRNLTGQQLDYSRAGM